VGEVEVDEAYVGGEEAGVRGRETVKKAIVVAGSGKSDRPRSGNSGRIPERRTP
jgi:hypothetical protein